MILAISEERKFLNIYLDGALKVTTGYADMQRKHQSEKLSDNFENVLQTIESVLLNRNRNY